MQKTVVLTDVPAKEVDRTVARLKADKYKVQIIDEGDGEFTIIATKK